MEKNNNNTVQSRKEKVLSSQPAPSGRRCVECNTHSLPGSSNAKFDFDYCRVCKKTTSFTSKPASSSEQIINKNLKL